MKFRTVLNIPKSSVEIRHKDPLLGIGSCFALNMAERLANAKFSVLSNPSGILYNPISITYLLTRLLAQKHHTEQDLFQHNDLWHSWQNHSQFSGTDKTIVLENINQSFQNACIFLQKTNRLILTFGTSFVYQHKRSQTFVANCHKVSAAEFRHIQLSPNAIVEQLTPILKALKKQLPALEIILTVSPIRHIRLGLIENQRSKAALLLAIQQLCEDLDFANYFPSYELVLDDLRDYRFYERDMIHPNQQAIDYIWEQFSSSFFSKKTQDLVRQIAAVQQAAQHRPFNPASAQHQIFVQNTLKKMDKLEELYPFLEFGTERGLLG